MFHIFIINMNLATLLIFSYTQLTHSDMSPFADATGLITFALAGCKLNKYSIIVLVCRGLLCPGDMGFWGHYTFLRNSPPTLPLTQHFCLLSEK